MRVQTSCLWKDTFAYRCFDIARQGKLLVDRDGVIKTNLYIAQQFRNALCFCPYNATCVLQPQVDIRSPIGLHLFPALMPKIISDTYCNA